MEALLRCPACGVAVTSGEGVVECTSCARTISFEEGIVRFSEPCSFYDKYADIHCPFALTPKGIKGAILKVLPFWSWREWRFWRAVLPDGGKLLDLGSGRGKEVFMEKADITVGMDASLAFLEECRRHYDLSVLCSDPQLPFRDGVFDVVVSSHVLGHIPVEHKDLLIREIARVLRPGGITAHIIETDSSHPIIRAAKQQPEVYRRQLVEQDGHVGLELSSKVVERFENEGFTLRELRVVDSVIPSVMYYSKHLDCPEYEALPRAGATQFLRWLDGSSYLGNLLYEVSFGLFHRTAEQWLGDPDRANFIHVLFQRSA